MIYLKIKRNHLYKEIIYSLLVIFLIVFSLNLYRIGFSNILWIGLIIIIEILYLLIKLYHIIKYIIYYNYPILIVLTIFIVDLYLINFIDFLKKSIIIFINKSIKLLISFFMDFMIIILSLICLFLYILWYNYLGNYIINSILVFIFILFILRYRKPILILIVTGFLVSIISYLLGLVQSTDFPIAAWIFLFGLIFAIIENIEKFINLDKYYPKDDASIANDEIIKRNKVILNFIIGLFFVISYITLKSINIPCAIEKTKLNQLNMNMAIGFLLIITNEILIIIYLLIFSKLLQKISKHSKAYDNQEAVGLFYSILTFGIKKDVKPKVIDKITIGSGEIDQVNPEVFIENIKEIPKDIHILLSKAEDVSNIRKLFPKKDVSNIRKLLVIYPNRKVYSCKISISKNIAKRISKVKLANTVNK